MNTTQLFPSVVDMMVFLLYHQSFFDVEKTVARQRVQILLLYENPYLIAIQT